MTIWIDFWELWGNDILKINACESDYKNGFYCKVIFKKKKKGHVLNICIRFDVLYCVCQASVVHVPSVQTNFRAGDNVNRSGLSWKNFPYQTPSSDIMKNIPWASIADRHDFPLLFPHPETLDLSFLLWSESIRSTNGLIVFVSCVGFSSLSHFDVIPSIN